MHKSGKYSIILLVVAALVAVPTGIMAAGQGDFKDPQIEAGSMAADALIVRPLGIVAIGAGFGLFVISSPFSALGGNIGEAWSALVAHPVKFTFTRALGDFD